MQKYFADRREEKIQLIKGIVTGEGFQLTPLPQVIADLATDTVIMRSLSKKETKRQLIELIRMILQEVLIIWGEFDQIFPVEKAHKVKE